MITRNFVRLHLEIGISSLKKLMENNITIKHLRFEA
jgi:hypothetical protein